ncbi:MAG: DUF1614 domain-containing protein, partial [Gammaproteobacteria bacterium]|nr:DUF1614 domain-containing protein [Gammaproteobacteria bacterium]
MFPHPFFIVLILLVLLFSIVQVGILSIAFDKLGLSQNTAFLIIFLSLFGSLINIPLFRMRSEAVKPMEIPIFLRGILRQKVREFHGYTTIAVNFGGCLIPLTVSSYLVTHQSIETSSLIISIIIMSAISYFASKPIHGIGVAMPIFVAPLCAALVALLLDAEHGAPLAYICGTLGVIIGADLFRLK